MDNRRRTTAHPKGAGSNDAPHHSLCAFLPNYAVAGGAPGSAALTCESSASIESTTP